MIEGIVANIGVHLEQISLLSYLVVFLGGILTSFTPCLYPIIPITVGFIGANSAGSRSKGFLLSLFYVLGIAVVYSCLGAIAALGGRIFGEISVNPWTYLIVGSIFLTLGLSMLGLFDIPIPGFLRSSKGPMKKGGGLLGAFIIGLFAGLVVGPCTAPVLGAVLAYVATKQSLFFGITLLFTYAMGMGLLLILLGTFTGLAATLPKSGKWLNAIRKIFGVVLIICAAYFIFVGAGRFM